MMRRPINFGTSINPNEDKELADDEKKLGIMNIVDIFIFLGFLVIIAAMTFVWEYISFSNQWHLFK